MEYCKIEELRTDTDGVPCYLENHYVCECGCEWQDTWSCACDDECPECRLDIEVHHSVCLVSPQDEADLKAMQETMMES